MEIPLAREEALLISHYLPKGCFLVASKQSSAPDFAPDQKMFQKYLQDLIDYQMKPDPKNKREHRNLDMQSARKKCDQLWDKINVYKNHLGKMSDAIQRNIAAARITYDDIASKMSRDQYKSTKSLVSDLDYLFSYPALCERDLHYKASYDYLMVIYQAIRSSVDTKSSLLRVKQAPELHQTQVKVHHENSIKNSCPPKTDKSKCVQYRIQMDQIIGKLLPENIQKFLARVDQRFIKDSSIQLEQMSETQVLGLLEYLRLLEEEESDYHRNREEFLFDQESDRSSNFQIFESD